MNKLTKIEEIIIKIEKFIVLVIMFLLTSGGIFKLIARNFMTSRIAIDISDSITSLVPHFIVILGFYGASLGLSRNEIIKIDISRYFLDKKHLFAVFKLSFVVVFSVMAIFWALAFSSIEFGDKIWIITGYIPVFSILMLKSFLRIFFKYVE